MNAEVNEDGKIVLTGTREEVSLLNDALIALKKTKLFFPYSIEALMSPLDAVLHGVPERDYRDVRMWRRKNRKDSEG